MAKLSRCLAHFSSWYNGIVFSVRSMTEQFAFGGDGLHRHAVMSKFILIEIHVMLDTIHIDQSFLIKRIEKLSPTFTRKSPCDRNSMQITITQTITLYYLSMLRLELLQLVQNTNVHLKTKNLTPKAKKLKKTLQKPHINICTTKF